MKNGIDEVIRRIARDEGLSEKEVLNSMQEAIDAGYYDPDPAVRAAWAAMPFDGKPTPQELIAYLSEEITGEEWGRILH